MKSSLAALAAFLALSGNASAQTFPTRPLTMVIPFAAGGPTDVLGRVVGARMGQVLGQQIVIENIGGAGGQTGSKRVAMARPDGYNFVVGTVGTHAQSQTLYKKPLYNAVTDFTPVALIAEVPIVLIARHDLPVTNLREFIAYAKANQKTMQFGSAGAGSATHLGCVVLNTAMGTTITHVPYRGTGPAMQDLVAGRIDFLCEVISTAKAQIEGGKVKALAIMTKERSPVLPDLPTALEQGLADVDAEGWNGFFFPKGTPQTVVNKVLEATDAVLDQKAVRNRLEGLGLDIPPKDERGAAYLGSGFTSSSVRKSCALAC